MSIYGNDYDQNKAFRDVSIRRHEDGPNHRSITLPNGAGRSEMMAAIEDGFAQLLAYRRPDLLLYQAGADPYREDPYSPLLLDHDDLLARDRRVFELAKQEDLPIAWVLAGGYTEDTSKVVRVHLNTFQAALDVYGA
jgi:acetoin utilization deacetylase AcuC-like enzyme